MTSKRERFARQLQEGREHHRTEVAFIRAHPIFTPEVGAQKAKEFIVNLTALTERIEGDKTAYDPFSDDAPAHYEVEAFFTPEQRLEVAALHARAELVEMRHKTKSYDELCEMLWSIGLCPDDEFTNGGPLKPIIAVHDLHLATEWWKSAHVYKPPFDGDDE